MENDETRIEEFSAEENQYMQIRNHADYQLENSIDGRILKLEINVGKYKKRTFRDVLAIDKNFGGAYLTMLLFSNDDIVLDLSIFTAINESLELSPEAMAVNERRVAELSAEAMKARKLLQTLLKMDAERAKIAQNACLALLAEENYTGFGWHQLKRPYKYGKYRGFRIWDLIDNHAEEILADITTALVDFDYWLDPDNLSSLLRTFLNAELPKEAEIIRKRQRDEHENQMEKRFGRSYNSGSAYDNPYYNDNLDMDQQSPDFWNEIG